MGLLGGLFKFGAVATLLVAIIIGSCLNEDTNLLKHLGVFRFMDRFEGYRGRFFMGMTPAIHEGTPWGFKPSDIPDLSGQTFVVTGGNVGLGYWSAYHLAAKKGTVVIACRSSSRCYDAASKLTEATGTKVEVAILDLSSFSSIRAFAGEFAKSYKALHGLILNAGVMVPPFTKTKEGLELQIGVNHFGHFLLTQLLLPQLAAAAVTTPSTVVAVSSAAHFDSYPEGIRWTIEEMNDDATYDRAKAYGQSKLANVLFAQELAQRMQGKGILVNSIHPGGVDTELVRHALEVMKRFIGGMAAEAIQRNVLPMLLWDPKDAALTQVYAAVSPELKRNKITGKYFHPIARETAPDPHAANQTLQHRLWAMSQQFIDSH